MKLFFTPSGIGKAFFPGFSYTNNCKNSGPVSLIATTGTHAIPGPAAGKIRVIFAALLTSGGATPAITVELLPQALFFGRTLSPGGVNAVSVSLMGTPQAWCLGAGELMVVTNTGAAACTLWYTYYDIPDTNRTLVRTSFSSTPVTIIPAAPAGHYNKWLMATVPSNGVIFAGVPRILALGFNDDTVAAIVQNYLAGVVIARSGSVAANAPVNGVVTAGGPDLVIEADAYQMATVAAITARNVNFMGCYETFEGTP